MDATTINSILGSILVVLILLAKWQYSSNGKISTHAKAIINLEDTDKELKKSDENIREEVRRQVAIRDLKIEDMEKRHSKQIDDFRTQNYDEHETIKSKLSVLSAQVSRNIGLAEGVQSNIQILIDKKNKS